jgi:hypothetical protein
MDPKTFQRKLKQSALYYHDVINASQKSGKVVPSPQ